MTELQETLKSYTQSEVEKYASQNGIWIILHGKVYDVTKFSLNHPGGDEILIENSGKDASEAFDRIGHSPSALELLKKFEIGTVISSDPNDKPQSTKWSPSGKGFGEENKDQSWFGSKTSFYMFAAGLSAAYIAYQYLKV